MVVRSDPFGYVFFVIKNPIAFKTDHSPNMGRISKGVMRRLRIIRETIKEEPRGKWVSANDVLKCDPIEW